MSARSGLGPVAAGRDDQDPKINKALTHFWDHVLRADLRGARAAGGRDRSSPQCVAQSSAAPQTRHDSQVSVQSPAELDRLLADVLVGRRLSDLQIVGINALKTVEPPITALPGSTVTAASVDKRRLEITAGNYVVRIDLQRTGRVVPTDATGRWTPRDGTSAPTVRLLLTDGAALDFTEPAKTKRITVAITPAP